jgi:hypothetical protein
MAKFEYSESKYNDLIDPQHASYDAIKTWEVDTLDAYQNIQKHDVRQTALTLVHGGSGRNLTGRIVSFRYIESGQHREQAVSRGDYAPGKLLSKRDRFNIHRQ